MLLRLLFHILFFDLITFVWEALLFLVIHVLLISIDAFCVVAQFEKFERLTILVSDIFDTS
jgi:hypothetical protein